MPGLFDEWRTEDFNGQEFEDIYPTGDKEKSIENLVNINSLLQQIHYYEKKREIESSKEWIDRHSKEEVYLKFLNMYTECQFSFIEVSFNSFPYTVLYQDVIDEDIYAQLVQPENKFEIGDYLFDGKVINPKVSSIDINNPLNWQAKKSDETGLLLGPSKVLDLINDPQTMLKKSGKNIL